jgi:hypothetical protein
MVKITFELDNNLNDKFRKTIASSKGLYRGAIQEALIEAINLWIKSTKTKKEKISKKEIKKNEIINSNFNNKNV